MRFIMWAMCLGLFFVQVLHVALHFHHGALHPRIVHVGHRRTTLLAFHFFARFRPRPRVMAKRLICFTIFLLPHFGTWAAIRVDALGQEN